MLMLCCRLESTGQAGRVQVSQLVAERVTASPQFLSSGLVFTARGMVDMKNKGGCPAVLQHTQGAHSS